MVPNFMNFCGMSCDMDRLDVRDFGRMIKKCHKHTQKDCSISCIESNDKRCIV